MGKRYLSDVLETMGYHGGSFTLFSEKELREVIDLAHSHDVYVSTSGFMEHLLTHPKAFVVVDRYPQKCKDVGFDVIELSSGFLSFSTRRLATARGQAPPYGLKVKPELGVQFGAGGDTVTGP